MYRIHVATAALVALAATACEDYETGPNISGLYGYEILSVTISPPDTTLFVTDSTDTSNRFQLVATAFSRANNPVPGLRFVWSSSNSSIASVDSLGVVTPHAPGTAEISASAHKVAHARVTVVQATPATIDVTPELDTLHVSLPTDPARDTLRFQAVAYTAGGQPLEGVRFTWESSSTSIATVDSAGLARARGEGTVTITARAGSASGTATLVVSVVP